jgi:hypothetical protein
MLLKEGFLGWDGWRDGYKGGVKGLSSRAEVREKVRGEYRVCRVKDSIESKAQRARR